MNTKKLIQIRVRRSNLLLGAVCGIGIAIVCFFTIVTIIPYWQSWAREPITISNNDLSTLSEHSRLHNYTVTGMAMVDTGFEEVRVRNNDAIVQYDANFGLLQINASELLLIRDFNNIDTDTLTYTGSLRPISTAIQEDIVNEINPILQQANLNILPLMLDTQRSDALWNIIGTILFAIASITILGVVVLIRRLNAHNHPIYKGLGRLGEIDTVIQSIENDMLLNETDTFGSLVITSTWATVTTYLSYSAMALRDAVWVYVLCDNERRSDNCTLYLHDNHGVRWSIACTEAQAREAQSMIIQRTPSIVSGYSELYSSIWKQAPAAFLDTVKGHQE